MHKIINNFETFHDTSVGYIKNNTLECIIETERITKHKHANFENPEDEVIPYLLNQYKIPNPKFSFDFKYGHHHELHAIAAFLSSGFDKANVLIIDAEGDQEDSVTLFYGKNKNIYELKKYSSIVSPGALYNAGAELIYGVPHCEGKLMGLACGVEPDYTIPSPIQFHEDGTVDTLFDSTSIYNIIKYIKQHFAHLFDTSGNLLPYDLYKAKLAANIQWWFTDQVITLTKYLKHISPRTENLCIGGGCFLNCETNGVLDRMGIFKNIYSIPAPADNGLVLGKIQQLLPEPLKIDSPYLGMSYNKTLEELLAIFRIQDNNSEIDNIINITMYSEDWIIERLKSNHIIIWFDGRSEFGPRALGHRSFLANPVAKDIFWELSINIKQREPYRPLAPITIDKLYPLIFNDPNPENLTQFMLKTVKVKDEWINKIPAVVHINKTARPQRLSKHINPELYSLIENWYKQTGIPCLINTSLNLNNQPLLETYSDLLNIIRDKRLKNKKISVVVDHKLCFDLL